MAIGIALLMGFHLPNNFDTPYQSSSITEFWRRWHISLSSWLRDYLYISLGGNRKGKIRTYFNLFITMLLGGLWHGASWKFVFWGAMHGTGLVIEKMLTSMIRIKQNFVTHKIGMLFTFHFVTFCWIFFRATSFDSAWAMLHQIVTNFDVNSLQQVVVGYQTVFIFIGIGYLLHFLPKAVDTFTESLIIKTPFLLQAVYLAAFIWLVIQVKSADVQPFIYFQF
jgi:D-alanyl-lipoteichoic acid acyltransferase DltB (MBOAT superfamily)